MRKPWGKTGAGMQTLSGSNTYTGGTTVSGGILYVNYDAGGSVGSGTITVDGTGSSNSSSFEIWAGNGATIANNFVVNSMGPAQNRGAINQDGGGGLVTLNGSVTLAGNSRIGVGGGSWNSMTISGQVSGTGQLYVYESQTSNPPTVLTLTNAANNYSGGTVIENGRFRITSAAALGTGTVDISAANSQLLVNEVAGTIPNSFILGNTGAGGQYGSGALVFHNDGTTAALSGTVTLAGANTYTGGTTINAGVLRLGNNAALGTGGLTVNSGGTLDLNGTPQPLVSALWGSGVIGNSSPASPVVLNYDSSTTSSTFGGTIQDSVGGGSSTTGLYVGSGTLALTGPNTHSGRTTVDGGRLVASAANTLSPYSNYVVDSGTFDVTNFPQTIKSLTMNGGALNIQCGNLLASLGTATFNGGALNLSGFTAVGQEVMACRSTAGSGFTATGVPNGDALGFTVINGQGQIHIVSTGPTTSLWGAGSANWSASGSWTPNTVPNAPGAEAVFNQTSGGTNTITLDSPQTVGSIVLGGSASPTSYVLTGSTLTLNNSGSGATITVANGSHEIDNTTLVLADSTGLSVSGSGTLTFGASSSVTDNNLAYALTMNGAGGTLILSGSDTYNGGTIVEAGTLIATNSVAIPTGTNLTVGAGGTFIFDPSVSGALLDATSLRAASTTVSPVPEPGTLLLLAAGLIVGFGAWRTRRV